MRQQRSDCGYRGLESSARSRCHQRSSSACADNCSQCEGEHEAISGQVFLVAFLRCISSAFGLDSNKSRGRRGGCERRRDLFAAHLLQSRPSQGESNRGAAANFEAGRVAAARRMHHAAGLGPRCGRVAGVAQRPPSCGALPHLENELGQLGAAIPKVR